MHDYLRSLNSAQIQAVEHSPDTPLQILAGPGSGKTRVLTTRIAHLIIHHSVLPDSICAVTFTNKAAGEMRERLVKLIGKSRTDEIRMGTFHALCARFLRRFASLVGLSANFTICDADESKKIISRLLKPYKEYLLSKNMVLTDSTVLSVISKAKAKGHSPAEFRRHSTLSNRDPGQKQFTSTNTGNSGLSSGLSDIDRIVCELYDDYEKTLRDSNSLDFDDLLVYGVRLFRENTSVGKWCAHILVDEFQDTNTMQYDLMLHIAAAAKRVTIVGDPDQSIYGWRSAEVGNLAKMRSDFPSTAQIFLEENYRSTGSIIAASLAVVAEDKNRIPKTLRTSRSTGQTPVLGSFMSEQDEAAFLAAEIKRLKAYSGAMFGWSDFVILLRFNALSRVIESALQKEGIPNRILAGHKFFERLEVKDLLAYLQVVDNASFVPAFVRAVNVPPRSIGDKTVAQILLEAEKLQISPMDVVERIYDGRIPDIKPPVKRKLPSFLQTIRALRGLAAEGTSPADLLRRLIDMIGYEEHLKKSQQDWEGRWENVQELINFATSEPQEGSDWDLSSDAVVDEDFQKNSEDTNDVSGHMERGMGTKAKGKRRAGETNGSTPLRLFLQSSMLSTDSEVHDDGAKEQVTISTCHAAKGLEWPVVMIPSVENRIFPFYRADDIEEERRLLYVACTRAQGLLYVTHTTKRMVAGEASRQDLSEFISCVVRKNSSLFTSQLPSLTKEHRTLIANILHRPEPEEAEIARRRADFHRTTQHHLWDSQLSGVVPAVFRPNGNSRRTNPGLAVPMNSDEGRVRVTDAEAFPASTFLDREPLHNMSLVSTRQFLPPNPFPRSSISEQSRVVAQKQSPTSLSSLKATSSNFLVSMKTLGIPDSLSPDVEEKAVVGPAIHSKLATGKRRLGMGRSITGYPSKKFKPPML